MEPASVGRINTIRFAGRLGRKTSLDGNDPSLLIVQRAIAKMQDRLEHALNIEMFARELNTSYSSFRHLFKQMTGTSPHQYLLELRLKRARALLAQTMQDVNEIARQVGFEDANYFFRFFKMKTGMTPGQWRAYSLPKQKSLPGELNAMKLHHPLLGHLYKISLSTGGSIKTASGCELHDAHPFGVNATATGLEYFPGTNMGWVLSISRPTGEPLSVQIISWPDDPDAPHVWMESSPERKGTTEHSIKYLRPNTTYEVKVNGHNVATLLTDKAGCIRFDHNRGYNVPQKFELISCSPMKSGD